MPRVGPYRAWWLALALLAAAALPGATTVAGADTGAGPDNTDVPTVSGPVQQGQRLVGSVGTWVGSGTVSYAYQWFRCNGAAAKCKSISGATGIGYRLGAKDVGHTLGFTVRATDGTGTASAYASIVGPVAAAAPAALASTAPPAVTGSAAKGQSLTVSNGSWSSTPSAYSYAWLRCNENGRVCVGIDGATASSYTVTDGDLGHALVAVVRATAGSATQGAFSTRTRPAKSEPGPDNSLRPTASGTARHGQRLVANAGTWAGSGTVNYSYQWFRCNNVAAKCKSISGATGIGYRLGAKDVGQTLGLTVRARDGSGTSSAYASVVGPIAPPSPAAPASTVAPVVTANAVKGQVLTVSNGSWSNAPSSYTYAWQRCNANGRICVAIEGATSNTYTVGDADIGHALLAIVRATAGSVSQTAFSTATAAATAS